MPREHIELGDRRLVRRRHEVHRLQVHVAVERDQIDGLAVLHGCVAPRREGAAVVVEDVELHLTAVDGRRDAVGIGEGEGRMAHVRALIMLPSPQARGLTIP